VQRQAVLDWHDETWTSRLNNRKTGAMVLIMQRLHESDLTGHLLDKGGWEHLCLPNEYEPSHPFTWPDDPRTTAGELLWPDRIDEPATTDLKRDLGSYGYAGQYQQRPAPAAGGIFQTAWWRYYSRALYDQMAAADVSQMPHFTRLWQSWDTALKDKTTSDYTVGQLWAQFGQDRWLLRTVRGRWSYPEALEQIRQMQAWAALRWPKYATHSIFVENAAMGAEVLSAGRRDIVGLVAVNVDRDKTSRAHAVTPQIESGHVLLPGAANADGSGPDTALTPTEVQDLIAECAAFPNAAHDDQVDALTQALDPRRWSRSGTRRDGEERWGKGKSIAGALKSWDV
jgi:predicted phage terminase large subunit-like protein